MAFKPKGTVRLFCAVLFILIVLCALIPIKTRTVYCSDIESRYSIIFGQKAAFEALHDESDVVETDLSTQQSKVQYEAEKNCLGTKAGLFII